MDPKLFLSMNAVISCGKRVLLLRESPKYQDGTNAGKFNVAGGRLKPGERFDMGLRREVREETGLDIRIGKPFFVSEWRTQVKGEQWQIVGIFFACESDLNGVILSEEHDEYIWIDPAEYKKINLIGDLFEMFEEYLKVCI